MARIALCLVVTALGIFSAAVQGATIISENFDELTPALTATAVGQFSAISGTNVDIVGGALFGSLCVSPESGNCVDLDGTDGSNSEGILQSISITLNPGINYFLSFDLIGSQRGTGTTTTVSLGSFSDVLTLTSGDTTTGVVSNQLITVGSTTVTHLTFASDTPGNIGALLDNVTLTSSTTAVPEPSALLPLAFAFLALWLLKRRAASLG